MVLHRLSVVEILEDQVEEAEEQILVLQLLDLEDLEFAVKVSLADLVVTMKVYLVLVVEQALLVVIKHLLVVLELQYHLHLVLLEHRALLLEDGLQVVVEVVLGLTLDIMVVVEELEVVELELNMLEDLIYLQHLVRLIVVVVAVVEDLNLNLNPVNLVDQELL